MAEQSASGSLILKLVIVVLTVTLVGSIIYPRILTDQEEANTALGHYRMEEIQKAALQYQRYKATYTDTLEKIFNFIRTSPQYAHYVDSVVVAGVDSISTKLEEFRREQNAIRASIPSATDSVMIDSLTRKQNGLKFAARQLAGYVEYIHDRMKNLPNMPVDELTVAFVVIDSKQFTLNMDRVKNSIMSGLLRQAEKASDDVVAVFDNVDNQLHKVQANISDYGDATLDSLAYCPTVGKEIRLAHIDTSVIKYLNIYCPIDSEDVALIQRDFMKNKLGGLTIANHGKIENGEKSWEESDN